MSHFTLFPPLSLPCRNKNALLGRLEAFLLCRKKRHGGGKQAALRGKTNKRTGEKET